MEPSQGQAPGEVVKMYVAAWAEKDAGARSPMLEQCWADDGTYTDPLMHLPGRDALSQGIANFHQRRPGESIVLTGRVDHHHKHLRFTWRWFAADGTTVIGEGVDFAELADDGKLGRIIGFFGTLPPLQSS